MGVLLSSFTSSLSREERVERNRDTMVVSLVVSRARNIPAATYRTRGSCYFCFCDETAVLCENVFFYRCWLFKNTSWIWWFWVYFRCVVCHWLLYTSRAKYNLPSMHRRPDDQWDDLYYAWMILSRLRRLSRYLKRTHSQGGQLILWKSTFKPYLCF